MFNSFFSLLSSSTCSPILTGSPCTYPLDQIRLINQIRRLINITETIIQGVLKNMRIGKTLLTDIVVEEIKDPLVKQIREKLV